MIHRHRQSMIRTRRASLAQSGHRFSLRQTRSVCAEIMLKQKDEIQQAAYQPSGNGISGQALRWLSLAARGG
jgi:hypothetical protein